jgi:hypothetical protein
MPAITLWQPWASLAACGLKTFETRSWPAPAVLIGKRVAIHAGARDIFRCPDARRLAWECLVRSVPMTLGAVVGTAVVTGCYRIGGAAGDGLDREEKGPAWITGSVPGSPPLLTLLPDIYGDYSPGRWAWALSRPRLFRRSVPARGRQRVWTWTPPPEMEPLD